MKCWERMHSNLSEARERRFTSLGGLCSGCCWRVLGDGGRVEKASQSNASFESKPPNPPSPPNHPKATAPTLPLPSANPTNSPPNTPPIPSFHPPSRRPIQLPQPRQNHRRVYVPRGQCSFEAKARSTQRIGAAVA